jgi:hypothetical protein
VDSDDPDRAAILARRRRFILLALTGAAMSSTTACRSKAQPCLSVMDPQWEYGDPLTTECPAELGEPVSLLNGTQIRLPDGITPEMMTELAPGGVRLSFAAESVGCIVDTPGGMINFFVMTVVPDDPSKSMLVLRDELLASFGYNAPTFFEEVNDEAGRSYEVVIEQYPAPAVEHALQDRPPSAGNDEPGRAFLRLIANEGQIYAVIYGAHPNAWNALQASLRASAASISFSSPDLVPSPE